MEPNSNKDGRNHPATEEQDRKALEGNRNMDHEKVVAAHQQADKDMEADAELTASNKNDDLDEGETARLGEDMGGII